MNKQMAILLGFAKPPVADPPSQKPTPTKPQVVKKSAKVKTKK